MRLIVRTDEGPVAVLVAEVPEEIKQEVAEEQGVDEKLEDFWSDIDFGRNPEPCIEGVPNPYREEEPWCPSDLQSLRKVRMSRLRGVNLGIARASLGLAARVVAGNVA
ncbi:hypothetical protein V7S43_001913 [Phytophthora oleae]|uniref:Uncharacterized protein n=1 Tax=Phytophthora oleae TaxID=2107226 RepID=A0ABD3G654_9STRA